MHFASDSLLFKQSWKVISLRQSQLLSTSPQPICLQSTSIPCLRRSSGEVMVTHFSVVLRLAFMLPLRVQHEVNVSEQDFCMYFSSWYRRGVRSSQTKTCFLPSMFLSSRLLVRNSFLFLYDTNLAMIGRGFSLFLLFCHFRDLAKKTPKQKRTDKLK